MDIGLAKTVDGSALREALAVLLPGSRIAVLDSVTELPVDADVSVVRQSVDVPVSPDETTLRFPQGLMVQRLAEDADVEAWLGELARQLSIQLDTAALFDASCSGGRPGEWLMWRAGAAWLLEERDDGRFTALHERREMSGASASRIDIAAAVRRKADAPPPISGRPPGWYRALLLIALLWSLLLLSGYSLGEIVLGAATLLRQSISVGDATRQFATYATSSLTAIPVMLAGAAGLVGSIALLSRRRWAWLPLLVGALAILWPLLVWFLAWAFWRAADDLGANLLLAQMLLSAATLFGMPVLWLMARRRGWLQPG